MDKEIDDVQTNIDGVFNTWDDTVV